MNSPTAPLATAPGADKPSFHDDKQDRLPRLNGTSTDSMSGPPAAYTGRNGQNSDTGPMYANPASAAPGDQPPPMDVADWDALYNAVKTRLRHVVGEQLGVQPDVPEHAASLSASLVQAVVLDCVSALDQLHTALQQERRQRQLPSSHERCEACAGTGRMLATHTST